MTKQQIISELVFEYKKTLNPKSKWIAQDVLDYKQHIAKLTIKELKEKLARLSSLNNPNSAFNKSVDKYIAKLDKNGMFDVQKMGAKYGLH